MSDTFTRSPSGLVEKWRFYDVPTIWVEGPTDIPFYRPILNAKSCRFEAYHGIDNANALCDSLIKKDYPYLIVMDGDYNILNRKRSAHKRIIVLRRYSIENYLWEPECVNSACLGFAQCGDDKDIVASEMERISEHYKLSLETLLIFDVAARRSGLSFSPLPGHIDSLLREQKCPEVDPLKVEGLIKAHESKIDKTAIRHARRDVHKFLKNGKLVFLLGGHFILGGLRKLFLKAAAKERGRYVSIPNDVFIELLAILIWHHPRGKDHLALRRKLRSLAYGLNSRLGPSS